jgi:hypothetical protein
MLSSGQVSADELDTCIDLLNDPEFVFMSMMAMTVSGRRPLD